MARFELKLPKMGESVAEATITSWLKEIGETIELDDPIVEVATDKVDSEVPSEVEGKLVEILFEKDTVVKVGETIAIIETDGDVVIPSVENITNEVVLEEPLLEDSVIALEESFTTIKQTVTKQDFSTTDRFYSPLVKNIAQTEGISLTELDSIKGTGKEGRVTKTDILNYIDNRTLKSSVQKPEVKESQQIQTVEKPIIENKTVEVKKKEAVKPVASKVLLDDGDEIIEVSRMGKLIAKHMIESVKTSAHVQSFIEVDVTNIVKWRNKVKEDFLKREGEKLTFTPIFMQAVAQTLKQYPLVNISFDGENIIKRGNINLGMAAALPDGNLIVPVIKNADRLNLVGMTKQVNDLAKRARGNNLKPDEVQGGTYTVTNVGSFGSITGTPIINQPEVAILALGAIIKKPAVIESPEGDFIGIRHKMIVSHSYDHRVINGAMGGMFIKTFKDILEGWDIEMKF